MHSKKEVQQQEVQVQVTCAVMQTASFMCRTLALKQHKLQIWINLPVQA